MFPIIKNKSKLHLLLNLLIHKLLNINLLWLLNSNSYLLFTQTYFLDLLLIMGLFLLNPAKNNLVPACISDNLYTFNHVVSYTRLWISNPKRKHWLLQESRSCPHPAPAWIAVLSRAGIKVSFFKNPFSSLVHSLLQWKDFSNIPSATKEVPPGQRTP